MTLALKVREEGETDLSLGELLPIEENLEPSAARLSRERASDCLHCRLLHGT